VLALTATRRKEQDISLRQTAAGAKASKTKRPPCPLCGSELGKGEKLHSVSYPAGKEKIVHIHGCPYCAPPGQSLPRRCPVCKSQLPSDGFAVGRMWQKEDKLHLHITGCTVCKPQYTQQRTTADGGSSIS
jgi:hypothetical protein